MEYYEHQVTAQVHLRWTTTNGIFKGVAYEAVPTSQLYINSPNVLPQPTMSFAVANATDLVFSWPVDSYSLMWSASVTGPYTNLLYSGVGPYTLINAFGPESQKFFRLQSY
jgi:hypothetical protein